MAYLLDADVFIRAKNLHYGFDFCPAFWDWIVVNHADGKVFSAEKIGDDLKAVADELSDWAASLQAGFFLRPDASVFPALAAVSRWGDRPKLRTFCSEYFPSSVRLLSCSPSPCR